MGAGNVVVVVVGDANGTFAAGLSTTLLRLSSKTRIVIIMGMESP